MLAQRIRLNQERERERERERAAGREKNTLIFQLFCDKVAISESLIPDLALV